MSFPSTSSAAKLGAGREAPHHDVREGPAHDARHVEELERVALLAERSRSGTGAPACRRGSRRRSRRRARGRRGRRRRLLAHRAQRSATPRAGSAAAPAAGSPAGTRGRRPAPWVVGRVHEHAAADPSVVRDEAHAEAVDAPRARDLPGAADVQVGVVELEPAVREQRARRSPRRSRRPGREGRRRGRDGSPAPSTTSTVASERASPWSSIRPEEPGSPPTRPVSVRTRAPPARTSSPCAADLRADEERRSGELGLGARAGDGGLAAAPARVSDHDPQERRDPARRTDAELARRRSRPTRRRVDDTLPSVTSRHACPSRQSASLPLVPMRTMASRLRPPSAAPSSTETFPSGPMPRSPRQRPGGGRAARRLPPHHGLGALVAREPEVDEDVSALDPRAALDRERRVVLAARPPGCPSARASPARSIRAEPWPSSSPSTVSAVVTVAPFVMSTLPSPSAPSPKRPSVVKAPSGPCTAERAVAVRADRDVARLHDALVEVQRGAAAHLERAPVERLRPSRGGRSPRLSRISVPPIGRRDCVRATARRPIRRCSRGRAEARRGCGSPQRRRPGPSSPGTGRSRAPASPRTPSTKVGTPSLGGPTGSQFDGSPKLPWLDPVHTNTSPSVSGAGPTVSVRLQDPPPDG